MSSELTLYSRLERCACTNLPNSALDELMQTFDAEVQQTDMPSKQKALKINKCLARCCYFNFGNASNTSLSCCERCWTSNQIGCMKKTSETLAFWATCILGLGSCGAHTYFSEYRGYVRTQTEEPRSFFEWLCCSELTREDILQLQELQNQLVTNSSQSRSENLEPISTPCSDTSQPNESSLGSPPPQQEMSDIPPPVVNGWVGTNG